MDAVAVADRADEAAAIELPGRVGWDPTLVTASIVLALLFGMAALMAARHSSKVLWTFVAAILLTLAIVSLHFTAMGAVEIVPDPSRVVAGFALPPTMLALAIAA